MEKKSSCKGVRYLHAHTDTWELPTTAAALCCLPQSSSLVAVGGFRALHIGTSAEAVEDQGGASHSFHPQGFPCQCVSTTDSLRGAAIVKNNTSFPVVLFKEFL